MGSVISLDPETISKKNDQRLKKLKSLAGRLFVFDVHLYIDVNLMYLYQVSIDVHLLTEAISSLFTASLYSLCQFWPSVLT